MAKTNLYLNLRVNLKRIIIFVAEAYNNKKNIVHNIIEFFKKQGEKNLNSIYKKYLKVSK